ncbi:MAG: hypothetical protein NTX48_05995 [Planctomycetales bacterium]|jgi:uncharacterized coiled-coil protein SlyX|nr:hypothetical protein [Planctomycetales bacterium]
MLPNRRLALQLTPLLDLLLIVMFSQYIENRDRSVAAQERLVTQEKLWDTRLAGAEAAIEQRRLELEKNVAEQKALLAELNKTYDDKYKSIINQHHQIGSILAESLNLPANVIAEVLKLQTTGSSDDAGRLQDAAERLQNLMQARGAEVFRFMLQVDEMQKHVTIWEIHVQENGQALITDSQQSFVTDFSSDADLATRLFESSKSFTEPKTLIVVLLTWSDAQAVARRRATDAMPLLMEQLRRDASGTRWYDFSIIGYRAQGSLFNSAKPTTP